MSASRKVLDGLGALELNATRIEDHLAGVLRLVNAQMIALRDYDETARAVLCSAQQCGVVLRHRKAWSEATLIRLARLLGVEAVPEPRSTLLLGPGATLDGQATRDLQRMRAAVNQQVANAEQPPRDFTPPRAA